DTLLHPLDANLFQSCLSSVGACVASATYPGGVDFNAFIMDVNGDRLADLVVAEPPATSGGRRQCLEGHRVYLNIGDRFDVWSTPSNRIVPNETWTSQTASAPLAMLRNRNPFCPGGPQHPSIDAEAPVLTNLPMGTSTFVDLNADGRLDLVFAYLD